MAEVELPTCAASFWRRAHHERQWRLLEGLQLFDGMPLAISAGDAWDAVTLRSHGLVQLARARDGLQAVALTDHGRRLLAAREAEREREGRLADAEART